MPGHSVWTESVSQVHWTLLFWAGQPCCSLLGLFLHTLGYGTSIGADIISSSLTNLGVYILKSILKLMLNLNKITLLPIMIISVRNGNERFSYFKHLYS